MFKRYKNHTLLGILLAATPAVIWAQDTPSDIDKELVLLLMYTAIVIAVVCLLLVVTVFVMIQQKAKPQEATEAEREKAKSRKPWWSRSMKSLTAAVPIEREADIDMGHAYDGIRELDNRLPPWWLYGFYVSIVFAFAYMWYFHISTDWSSEGQYTEEVRVAEVQKAAFLEKMALLVDETNVAVLTDEVSLAKGKKVFESLCVACHASDGGGGIGPNLTDNYWLHGGDIKSIFKTVKYGVPEKGMISWQDQLNPVEMHQVSSYIQTLVGTTPANPKDPQGDLYNPSDENSSDEATEPSEPTEGDEVAIND